METGRGGGGPHWPWCSQFTDLHSFRKGVIWLSIAIATEIPPGVSTPRSYARCNFLSLNYVAGAADPESERCVFSLGPFNDVS